MHLDVRRIDSEHDFAESLRMHIHEEVHEQLVDRIRVCHDLLVAILFGRLRAPQLHPIQRARSRQRIRPVTRRPDRSPGLRVMGPYSTDVDHLFHDMEGSEERAEVAARTGGAAMVDTIPLSITGNSGALRSSCSRCGRSRERRLTRTGGGPGRGQASLWCPRGFRRTIGRSPAGRRNVPDRNGGLWPQPLNGKGYA